MDQVWAVPAARIEEFFRDKDADVRIIPMPERVLGSLRFPQTRVVISGENAEKIYHEFKLNFLSAGG